MKNVLKHKNKIITGVLIIAVLVAFYLKSGSSPENSHWQPEEIQTYETAQILADTPENTRQENIDEGKKQVEEYNQHTDNESEIIVENPAEQIQDEEADYNTAVKAYQPAPIPNESVPSGSQEAEDNAFVCTLLVSCDTVLRNINNLEKEKALIVPENGIIFAKEEVEFYEGESVFDVTLREMKKHKIHFEYVYTPIYNSAYIEGIGNLYEFDCGELSGWMYKVNGEFPNCSCSDYKLADGDRVEWVYSCDLGADIGKTYPEGKKK